MWHIVEFLAFYVFLPLMILAAIIFDVTLIRNAPSVAIKVRSLGGFVGALFSVTLIFLDLSYGGLIHLPPVNSVNLWAVSFSMFVIGFLFLLFIDFLLRRGVVPFVITVTTAGSIISPYYLVSLSQSRELTSIGVLSFAVGWIGYFSIMFGRYLVGYNMEIKGKVPISGNTNVEGVNLSDREITFSGDIIVGRDIILGSKDTKPVPDDERAKGTDLKRILKELGKQYFKISIAYPKLISKRFGSPFIVQLYFEELATNVKMKIMSVVGENYTEEVYKTELKYGQVVKVKLFSPDIVFAEPIIKKLDSSLNTMTFLGKPSDLCEAGEHKVTLSILDNKTNVEYQSETFSVKVVDFAFDHISRPLLSKASTTFLAIGSFAMFVLTFLEQIDKTVGLTSGTAAGVLAAVVYANFYNLYQRIRPNTP